MKISFKQVIPTPLPDSCVQSSKVWGQRLTLDKNQSIQIEAQSGRGKSTLLHILYGLRFDYKGVCKIDGSEVSGFTTEQWRELWTNQFSLLFQDLRLFLDLTARQNLELLPDIYSAGPNLEEMCKELEIDHLLDSPVNTLSLGQRQRFALVRCLLKPFKWLLLDEPFSHLDEGNAKRAAQLIENSTKLRRAGILHTSLSSTSPLTSDLRVTL